MLKLSQYYHFFNVLLFNNIFCRFAKSTLQIFFITLFFSINCGLKHLSLHLQKQCSVFFSKTISWRQKEDGMFSNQQ